MVAAVEAILESKANGVLRRCLTTCCTPMSYWTPYGRSVRRSLFSLKCRPVIGLPPSRCWGHLNFVPTGLLGLR